MAFGPSTDLFQTAIQLLMQGRQPNPLAPVPAGPMTPPGGFLPPLPLQLQPPEPAPVAPLPARDESLIEQLTGPRPVAPVAQPVSLLQKIALALQGFGAGTQGQGPQFLAGLREERERPQREFRSATERYEANRRGAIEFAENKRQRERAEIQRRADIQSDREFQSYELDVRDRMQQARDLRQQAAALEREEVKVRAEIAEQQRKERAQQERDARQYAAKFGGAAGGNAPPKIAKELGEYYAGITDSLSPAAAKWESTQAQLNEIRLRRAEAGGTGGKSGATGASDKAVEAIREFEAVKQKLIEAVAVGNAQAQRQLMTDMNRAFRGLARFPEIEAGFDASGKWPYAKLRTPQGSLGLAQQQQAAQPTAQAPTNMFSEFNSGLAGSPQAIGMTRAQAKAKLVKEGFTPAEADAELDRLGIQ